MINYTQFYFCSAVSDEVTIFWGVEDALCNSGELLHLKGLMGVVTGKDSFDAVSHRQKHLPRDTVYGITTT